MFGWDFDAQVGLRFWSWILINLWYDEDTLMRELNPWVRCAFGNVYPLGPKSTRFAATFQWLKSRVKNNPLKMLKVATKALSSPPPCAPGRLMSWQQVDIESVRIHHTTRPSADQPHASTWDSRWDGTFRSAFSLVHLFCMVCHCFGFCCCGRILIVFNWFFLSF